MPQQQILVAIQQLVAEGRAITTATVRSRLTTPVPLSELLALVSRYKQAPDSLPPPTKGNLVSSHAEDNQHSVLQTRLQTLEHTVAEQALKLTRLEHLLMATLDGETCSMNTLNNASRTD